MEWINNIQNPSIKDQISNNDALVRKIHVLITMSATEIKNSKKSLLKGISIRIAEELFKSSLITESQYIRIKKQKEHLKKIK
jgi:hypothetical protein